MAGKKVIDQYCNIAAVKPTEASAGTAVYEKFAFPFSIMDKMALLISRIEYLFGSLQNLNSGTDYVLSGLSVSSNVSDLTIQSDPAVIDSCRIARYDFGTAASGMLQQQPLIKDFSSLPGGGLLVAPNPLYGFCLSSGAGGVMLCWIRMYYTYMELSSDEYWQLVESRRVISS